MATFREDQMRKRLAPNTLARDRRDRPRNHRCDCSSSSSMRAAARAAGGGGGY